MRSRLLPLSSLARTLQVRRAVWLSVAVMLAGCQAQAHRPDFIARSVEDCARGDEAACSMLDALRVPSSDPDAQTGLRGQDRVQAGKDARVIMDSVNRAQPHASVTHGKQTDNGT